VVGPPGNGGIRVSASDEWVLVWRMLAEGAYVDATEIVGPGITSADAIPVARQ
jgi:hypothetical protein